MMEQAQLRAYQAQRSLRDCGLNQDSINAITSTTVITKNGAQHVVPMSQKFMDETPASGATMASGQDSGLLQSLQQQVQDSMNMFTRFKQFADQRIMALEKAVAKMQEENKDLHSTILTLKSNRVAQVKAEAQGVQQPATPQEAARPVSQAIDRNKVAPADVQVENIFYCGTR